MKDNNVNNSIEGESKLKRNFFLIIVLTLSGSFIYTLPYFRLYYYDAFMRTFQMTNTQMGIAQTYFGLFGVIGYLIGGVISDKISIKILIPFSLIATSLGGFYLLTTPSPNAVLIVHGIWGITSLLTFWPALLKALKSAASSNEQGKAFGIFEGGRGISNAASAAIALAVFGLINRASGEMAGIKGVILFYSSITAVLGVLTVVLLRNVVEEERVEGSDFSFKHVKMIIKNPTLWLMSGIIFCAYTVNMSYYYIAPYASLAFVTTAFVAAAISSGSQYVRPFAAVGAGVLGDRINNSKVMLIAQIASLVAILAILVIPTSFSIWFLLVATIIIFFAMYMTQSMHFAIMNEGDLPEEAHGTAIGIICALGYLPEAIAPWAAGTILDKYTGTTGYRLIFILMAVVTLVGIGLTLIWLKRTKVKREEILALNKEIKVSG